MILMARTFFFYVHWFYMEFFHRTLRLMLVIVHWINLESVLFCPISSGILEGIASGIPNGGEVMIECPPNWYENNDLLGFSLYCVGFPPGFGSCSNKFYLEAQVSEQRH